MNNKIRLVGKKCLHGSPYYENEEIIEKISKAKDDRIKIVFESGCITNMTQDELETLSNEGEIDYKQHFRNEHDFGYARMIIK
jgi:hypothetical protein